MILKMVFLWQLILLLSGCSCEAANNHFQRHANRRQKKLIEGAMDLKADPCDDFFQYACGNWHHVVLHEGVKNTDVLEMMDDKVNQELAHSFNSLRMHHKPKFIEQAYTYYKSCTIVVEYQTIKYLAWLKANDNFIWPALWTQPKNNTHFDWVQMLAKLRTYGFNDIFIAQSLQSKVIDSKINLLALNKPVANGGFKALKKINLKGIIFFLSPQLNDDQFKRLWLEVEEFEEKLNQLDTIEDIAVDNELEYEKVFLFDIDHLPIKWLKDYVKIILNQTELNGQMQLYIKDIPYMKALDELLAQYSQRFLCKYLEIRFLWYLQTLFAYDDIECVSSVRSLMPIAMHWQYEQLHPELLAEYDSIYEIFNNIRKHFNATVVQNKHGFNATVVNFLQNKIDRMSLRLNNVPRVDTVKTLESFYSKLNLDTKNFYSNHLKLLRFNFLAELDLLKSRSPILDKTYLEEAEIGSSPSPYFAADSNTVVVPLTFLQHPVYTAGLKDLYKYSSFGYILGHEIFHGFDDIGLLHDASGNFKIIQFEDNPLFNASVNCLQDFDPNVVSEKIADISGLRYTFQSYFDTDRKDSYGTVYLHGIEMTSKKMFFLNFAQFFCGNSTTEETHGSDQERVIDALSNVPEFSKEFKCHSNQRFYSHELCHLWR